MRLSHFKVAHCKKFCFIEKNKHKISALPVVFLGVSHIVRGTHVPGTG